MMLFLIACLSFAAAVVLVELAARAWISAKRTYWVHPPGQRLRLEVDLETLPELEPTVRYDVNDDGERGPEVPRVARGQRLYRVLVAGGSQPEGYLLDQDVCWPGALQQMLSAPEALERLGASNVHVGSVARSGVGSEALDTILARVLPRYDRLSAIVILVGASDVLRWLEEGAPAKPCSPVPTHELFSWHPEGPFGWTPGTLAALELARRAQQRIFRPQRLHPRAGRWIGRARAMRARAKVIHATMPDPSPVLAHFEKHLRRVIERACTHAERVIVVRQSWYGKEPLTAEELAHMWHGGAGQAWREEVTAYYSLDVTARLMAAIDASTARVATALGVDQIDLMSVLEPNLATYYDFFHLTPSGARAVAAAVARMLLQHPAEIAVARGELSACADLRAS